MFTVNRSVGLYELGGFYGFWWQVISSPPATTVGYLLDWQLVFRKKVVPISLQIKGGCNLCPTCTSYTPKAKN